MVNWYVIITSKSKEMYERLAKQDDMQVFWPLRKTRRKDNKAETLQPLITRYIFVRTQPETLQDLFTNPEIARIAFPMRRRLNKDYQTIPEDEMQHFIWFCENITDDFVIMDKLFSELKDNVKVRVKDGIFKNMEGVLCKIKHQNRFTFKIGELAIYIDSLRKWNLEIIDDGAKAKAAYNLYQDIDALVDFIQNIPGKDHGKSYLDNAQEIITEILLYHIHIGQNTEAKTNINAIKRTMPWLNKPLQELFKENLLDVKLIHAIIIKRKLETFDRIVTQLLSAHHNKLATEGLPDISTIIPATNYRPFLTTSAAAYKEIYEYTIVRHRQYIEYITPLAPTHYAHIALIDTPDGILAIANTTSLCKYAENMQETAVARYDVFNAIRKEQDIHAITFRTAKGISGPSVLLSYDIINNETLQIAPEARKDIKILINTTLAMCQEIWTSPYASTMRRELQHVWTTPLIRD